MTQEERLLLTDLCGRLMYGVKCKVFDFAIPYTLSGVSPNTGYDELYFEQLDFKESDGYVGVKFCKPYLFPLSSMTEEQKIIYGDLCYAVIRSLAWDMQAELNKLVDWLNKNHFDYRGLIEKGLAIDCTNLNIY